MPHREAAVVPAAGGRLVRQALRRRHGTLRQRGHRVQAAEATVLGARARCREDHFRIRRSRR